MNDTIYCIATDCDIDSEIVGFVDSEEEAVLTCSNHNDSIGREHWIFQKVERMTISFTCFIWFYNPKETLLYEDWNNIEKLEQRNDYFNGKLNEHISVHNENGKEYVVVTIEMLEENQNEAKEKARNMLREFLERQKGIQRKNIEKARMVFGFDFD